MNNSAAKVQKKWEICKFTRNYFDIYDFVIIFIDTLVPSRAPISLCSPTSKLRSLNAANATNFYAKIHFFSKIFAHLHFL